MDGGDQIPSIERCVFFLKKNKQQIGKKFGESLKKILFKIKNKNKRKKKSEKRSRNFPDL